MDARAVLAEIMNMMTICKRAACSTDAPPRIAPVIMPGIETMPRTLFAVSRSGRNIAEGTHLMVLTVGVSARRRPSVAMGLQASSREAPKARYVSTLSLFSL